MAEESRIRAARRVRGILLGFPPADRALIIQLASAEGKSTAEDAPAKRRGRKPGPKPKAGNGHVAAAPAKGLKKDGTPRKKPGPRPKTEQPATESAPEQEAQPAAQPQPPPQ